MKKLSFIVGLLLSLSAQAAPHLVGSTGASSIAPGADVSNANATPTGGAASQTVANNLASSLSLSSFGAVCDGTTDDTVAIQAAFDSHKWVVGPSAVCRTTNELVATTGTRFVGRGNYSGAATGAESTGVTRIFYDGAGGANSVVVRIAAAAVGTDTTTNVQNVTFTNVVVDGGSKAEFGVYMVRAWLNNQLDYITVTRTLKHGFWANRCWGGPIKGWGAIRNRGAGISVGIDSFGWSTGFADAVDETVIDSAFAYFNGYNADTSSYMNVFNETTQTDKEYGIGVGDNRAMTFINAQTARNGGAGIYIGAPTLNGPTNFITGYQELNGQSSGSTAQWWLWDTSATATWALSFEGMHLGQTPAARLTGTAPSRAEMGVHFVRMPFLGTINSDWSNYRIIDSDRNVVLSGTAPLYGATSGAVKFAGIGGDTITDDTKLFWDDTNNRLGIGNASPSVALDVTGAITLSGAFTGTSIVGTSSTISNAATNTTASVSAPSGSFSTYELRTSGSARWQLFKTNTAESGLDVGSNLNFVAKDDTGATIDSPLALTRASGGTITLGGTTSRSVTLADGSNFIFNTTTGTKFGTATTNKIGFWNATPIVRPDATTDLGTVLSNIGFRPAGSAYPISTSGAVVFSGASNDYGTPTSLVLTNATGCPIGSCVSGLGSGVATLLGGASSGTGGPAGTASPTFTGIVTGPTLTASGAVSKANIGVTGAWLNTVASTATDTASSGTVAVGAANAIGIPTLASSSATTFTRAVSLYIAGVPVAGSGVTITNARSLFVAAGVSELTGGLTATGGTVNLNASSNAAINVCTGTCNALTTIGGGSGTVAVGSPFTLGSTTAATSSTGELAMAKITASGTAPGANYAKMEWVCGTNAGSAKLISYAGTSTTPVTIVDNVGSGVTGC